MNKYISLIFFILLSSTVTANDELTVGDVIASSPIQIATGPENKIDLSDKPRDYLGTACMYSNRGYTGEYKCIDYHESDDVSWHIDLASIGMANKISSIVLYGEVTMWISRAEGVPDGEAYHIYDGVYSMWELENYSTHIVLERKHQVERYNPIKGEVQLVTAAYVCWYSSPTYYGTPLCLSEHDMSDVGTPVGYASEDRMDRGPHSELNNRFSSVRVVNPYIGSALEVKMHSELNFRGQEKTVYFSIPYLSDVDMDNKISSVSLRQKIPFQD